MKPAKEYSILPQCERENGYIIRPETDPVKKRSCVLFLFVILAVIVIISGALALVVGLFYSDEFTSTVNTYWKPLNSNHTTNGTNNNSTTTNSVSGGGGSTIIQNDTVAIPSTTGSHSHNTLHNDSGNTKLNGTATTNPEITDHSGDNIAGGKPHKGNNEETEGVKAETAEEISSEEFGNNSTKPITTTTVTSSGSTSNNKKNETDKKHGSLFNHKGNNETESLIEKEEEFAESMKEFEKYVETITGIHRAEFVIPLLMVLVFVMSLIFAWCCCYFHFKRKQNARRRDISKIITDLQAGDKAILMDQDDDE